MKKRFWKWNAIAAFVLFILYCVAGADKPAKGLGYIPGFLTMCSCVVLLNHKNKPDDAIVGLAYDEDKTDPKQLPLHIMIDRIGIVILYSFAPALLFMSFPHWPEPLRIVLVLGFVFIGIAGMVWVVCDYIKKRKQLNK